MKPCKHEPELLVKPYNYDCRICWLYENDDDYRQLWGGAPRLIEIVWEETFKSPIDYFDRVVVISLPRRKDRLDKINSQLSNWPFKKPEVFEAFDGKKLLPPSNFDHSSGAWGCLLSHTEVLRQAMQDNVQHLLVLEDDFVLCDDFKNKAQNFINAVPDDFDGLMLGGEHRRSIRRYKYNNNVVQVRSAIRTHCYSARPRYQKALFESLLPKNNHCDQIFAKIQQHHTVLAPPQWLVGQGEGVSDICGEKCQITFFND